MSNKKFVAILLWIAFVYMAFTELFVGADFKPMMYKLLAFVYVLHAPMIAYTIREDWGKK